MEEGLLAEPFGLLTAARQVFYGLAAAMAAICAWVSEMPCIAPTFAIASVICCAVLGRFPFAPWQPAQFAL